MITLAPIFLFFLLLFFFGVGWIMGDNHGSERELGNQYEKRIMFMLKMEEELSSCQADFLTMAKRCATLQEELDQLRAEKNKEQ